MGLATVLAALCSVGSFASAQVVPPTPSTPPTPAASTAVMLDGTVLTQKIPLSTFATEGPIWNLDLANQGIVVTGKTVTIANTVNGTPLLITGSSVLGQDGEALTGIGATDFDRLSDANAITRDVDTAVVGENLGPRRLGPTRSIFSATEGPRNAADAPGLLRDSVAQAAIEQNFFQLAQLCYEANAHALPADFLNRAGLRGEDAANWTYPASSGGTLKSAGHVYVDSEGNEYFVPDIEVVIELSENVAEGVVTSAVRGDGTRPDSFVIGDLLLIFNQDPRFGADVLGLAEAVIPREEFFKQVVTGETTIPVIGHMVSEHVMFVQEVLSPFVDPAAGIVITADRFVFRGPNVTEARWRGIVDKPEGLRLVAVMIQTIGGQETRREFNVPMAIDPLTGEGTYDARIRPTRTNLRNLTHIEMQGIDTTTGEIKATARFDIRPFRI
ncbi:MAG: hypothetical protein QE273_03770 [Verrucomicrobiales bacterium]|nr:hypothetical protein [Verrucomicrobiales bacterium]